MDRNPTRRGLLGAMAALGSWAATGCTQTGIAGLPTAEAKRYSSFRPGEIWLDTAGKPIQAHAGSLISVGSTYYWYGENKEFTTGQSAIESWGIRFYSSTDLYNWTDLGPLIAPDQSDPTSPLSPKIFPERPHILYNSRTAKFVCWIKVRGRGPQFRTVMEANRITGPYTMVARELHPAGMAAGDFDLLQDEKTGKAYMYFEHDHKEVVCIELTQDYRATTDRYTVHLPGKAPDSREGIACFQRGGKLYLTSSGLTGYFPNPSRIAVSDGLEGPFSDLGILHESDTTETSFGSQISDIFKVPGKDVYIALADRWLPDLWTDPQFQTGEMSRLVRSAIGKTQMIPRPVMTPDERIAIQHAAGLARVNTSISRYVWLPLVFERDRPRITWHEEWKVQDFTE